MSTTAPDVFYPALPSSTARPPGGLTKWVFESSIFSCLQTILAHRLLSTKLIGRKSARDIFSVVMLLGKIGQTRCA